MPTVTERKQKTLLEELAKDNPRLKQALQQLEQEMKSGMPPADVELISLHEDPSAINPQEFNSDEILPEEIEASVPVIEDQHIEDWMKRHNADLLPSTKVREILTRIRAAAGRVAIRRPRQASTGYILPSVEITRLANEASRYLKLNASIPWSELGDAISKIESEGKIIQLAAQMYDEPSVDFSDPQHMRVYQSLHDAVVFVLQCHLENNDYEWNPKSACWEK